MSFWSHQPPANWGLLSLVLGAIGLLLFFLPILGLPISAFGLLFGLVGCVWTMGTGSLDLRWSLLGSAVSAMALGVIVAIAYAPAGYQSSPQTHPLWQPVPDRPVVSPPSQPGGA